MDSQIRQFYNASKINTDWSLTVEHWCLPLLFPDCQTHFLKYTHELHQAIFKFNNIGALTVRPEPASDSSSQSMFELDSHCMHSKLSYNLAINGVPNSSAWTSGTNSVNALLAKPFYKRDEPLRLKMTEFRTHYTWQLPDVGGSPAVLVLELVYGSSADRLFGRSPTEVTLSTRLLAKSTPLAINHAEGLIEYLRYGADSGTPSFSGIATGLLIGVFAMGFFGIAYSHYAGGGGCCGTRSTVDPRCPTQDDLHMYQCVDQPTVFRFPNV